MSDILSLYICNIGILEISNANRSDINSPPRWIEENRLEVRLQPFRENNFASQLIRKKPSKPRQKMKQKFLEKYVYFWPIMMFLSLIRFGLNLLKSNLNAT